MDKKTDWYQCPRCEGLYLDQDCICPPFVTPLYDAAPEDEKSLILEMFKGMTVLLRQGSFKKVHQILLGLDLTRLSARAAVGFATITYPYRTKLRRRGEFMARLRDRLDAHPNRDELLPGLGVVLFPSSLSDSS